MELLIEVIKLVIDKYFDIMTGYVDGNSIHLRYRDKSNRKRIKIVQEKDKLQVTISPKKTVIITDLDWLEKIILENK